MMLAGAAHLPAEGGGLHSPQGRPMPACECHAVDQRCFVSIAGLKLEHQSRSELVVAAQGCALRNGGIGEEPVKRCVLRRDSFAFRGDGSGGFSGVGAIRFYLAFGCHLGPRVSGGRGRRGWVEAGRCSGERGCFFAGAVTGLFGWVWTTPEWCRARCDLVILLYIMVHENDATDTSSEELPEAAQPARDGSVRGSRVGRRPRADSFARQAARGRRDRFGADSCHDTRHHRRRSAKERRHP